MMLLARIVSAALVLAGASAVLSGGPEFATNHLYARNSTGLTDAVTWDSHSLSIFGQRTFILSAEYHPWRLPNPNLWADVFQKIKANGFNTVSFYVHWGTHYPAPDTNGGAGDFAEGTYRDIQRFIDEAKKAGLWLIARPGPYINAETTGGGFPGWVGNIAGNLRTNNPNYTETWVPYMTSITKIIARNQITEGGPIILVQAENEFSEASTRSPYMQAILDLYRANGVVVPITHNDQHGGRDGNYSPDRGPGAGRVDIYCSDSYPQGTSSWNNVQTYYYPYHKALAASSPLCLAEFGGGWLLGWGQGTRGGTGYEKFTNELVNAQYEDVFYKENYAQTTTILSVYMLYGGTNWGHTYEPTIYSSYDYGAGINENRVATPKMNEMRLQGLFLRVAPDLLASTFINNGTQYVNNPVLYATELRNSETGAAFYFVRHLDARSTTLDTGKLSVNTSMGALSIPQDGTLTVNGRESKIIVTDHVFGKSATQVVYSTAEIFTTTTIDDTDYLILYTGASQSGELALQFSAEPTVSADPTISTSYASNLLTLNFSPAAGTLAHARIQSADGKKVTVIVMDKPTAKTWHAPLIAAEGNWGNFYGFGSNQTVLVGGPYLVRTARIGGNTLYLEGDINGTTTVEFLAPASVSKLNWNSRSVSASKTTQGTYVAQLAGAGQVVLPKLDGWKVMGSLPEIDPKFDDSSFVAADQTTTNYTNLPPLSRPYVLYSQQYGFFGGHIVWRGHFNASGTETAFNLTVMGGFGFGYGAWLNGVHLGGGQGNLSVSQTTNLLSIPEGALKVGEDNVLVVLQDHAGIVETSTSSGKEPRGIRGYDILSTSNTSFSSWTVQGTHGTAARAPDTFRGHYNEGGLFAERVGAHLPGFSDGAWAVGSPVRGGEGAVGVQGPGVNFYRTTFALSLPTGADVPIRLRIVSNDVTANYRAQVYLNGWMLGKYINELGPQTDYVLPAGILRAHGDNTLGLALWALDKSGAALDGLELISDGAFMSSYKFEDWTAAPNYAAQKAKRPGAAVVAPM